MSWKKDAKTSTTSSHSCQYGSSCEKCGTCKGREEILESPGKAKDCRTQFWNPNSNNKRSRVTEDSRPGNAEDLAVRGQSLVPHPPNTHGASAIPVQPWAWVRCSRELVNHPGASSCSRLGKKVCWMRKSHGLPPGGPRPLRLLETAV